ncbi:DUF2164 domain-containing protein [Alkalibacillus aidingensis]|uniref:DUF2164 domain-containing protein n=1 Tax=Alkalibacillus aidingensis TaxID=2747607 RepID=UPI001660C98D|nr:DUF2164 domain-containing protein [Alkalibacillus aidingensis]
MMNFSHEEKQYMINQIQSYYFEEHGQEIGELAAGNFLEFVSNELGLFFYNQGVREAKEVVEQKLMNVDEDLVALERPVKKMR